MALQFSAAIRNARADLVESTVGTSAKLRIYTGPPPAAPGDAATGTLLATLSLPGDWLTAASGGAKAKSGTWSGTAVADGTAGYWRVWDSGVTACGMQGTVSGSGGGGDLELSVTDIVAGATITVSSFGWTEGNG